MTGTLQVVPAAVLELLALPAREGLTDDQARGRACVWCGREPLTVATSADLGEQTSVVPGSASAIHWYPRACRPCAAERAHKALFQHAPMCEQCVDEAGRCEVSLILYRLVREGLR